MLLPRSGIPPLPCNHHHLQPPTQSGLPVLGQLRRPSFNTRTHTPQHSQVPDTLFPVHMYTVYLPLPWKPLEAERQSDSQSGSPGLAHNRCSINTCLMAGCRVPTVRMSNECSRERRGVLLPFVKEEMSRKRLETCRKMNHLRILKYA